MAAASVPPFKLTVGELFPADDVVAQWVFTLTSVSEDLTVLLTQLQGLDMQEKLREGLFIYRLLITRLLEARRLVDAWQAHADIREFSGGKLEFNGVNLLGAYTRPSEHQRSQVERLYVDSRNRTTHYSKVGGHELQRLLSDYQNFPARLVFRQVGDAMHPEYQWVTAIRFQDAVATTPWSPSVVADLKKFGQQTAALCVAWTMLSNVCVILLARRRGIAIERVLDDPEKLREFVEDRRSQKPPDL